MTKESLHKTIQVVASDLDGTLLAPDHQVSEFTKQTLKLLHEQGFKFVFATGRHYINVSYIRELVGIPAYMITSNGAHIHDQDSNPIYKQHIPSSLVQRIIDAVPRDPDVFVHIYQDDKWLIHAENENTRYFSELENFKYQLFNIDKAPTNEVVKIFFIHAKHNHEQLASFEKKLNNTFGDQISVAFSTPNCLEVMAANVSKGNALDTVAKLLDVSLDNCIAFGDGMNDVEMLSMAGKGLVMGTSHPKVMQSLPDNEVIGSHANDAVAHYLRNHLLA